MGLLAGMTMSQATICVHTATLRVEAIPVDVEVGISGGIPGITIVGMLDSSIMNRSRVRCSLSNCRIFGASNNQSGIPDIKEDRPDLICL